MRAKGMFKVMAVCALILCFASCQSTKVAENSVEPYALLSEESVLYMKMSVKENKEMFFTIFDRVSDSGDAARDMVYKYIDEIYMVQRENDGSFEAVCKGNFPPSMVKMAVKKINWKTETFTAENGAQYKIYNDDFNHQIAFPDKNTMCFSRDVSSMLSRYATGAKMTAAAQIAKEKFSEMDSTNLLFLIANVEDYVKNAFGRGLMPNIESVYGFSYLKDDGSLDSDVYIELKDSSVQALNAVARVFNFILAMMGENITVAVEEDKERIHLSHMNVFDF